MHVRKIVKVIPEPNIFLVSIPFSGHPTSHYLSEVGLIKDILVSIAKHDSIDEFDFFKNKNLSKSYFHNLSINLLKKNHFKWALAAIDSAIRIDNKIAEYHAHKSIILERTGRIEEAVTNISQAIRLNPSHTYYQNNLSRFMSKKPQLKT
jgi:Tfp pilus assembly protein PilF